jgi:two-component system, response regulator YesN
VLINMMIVDDEERARVGIRTLIDWPLHGISICAEARDGLEALSILAISHVDILLTDIRMPEMDGLELIKRVSEEYPHVKCVIMSGYDDFSYAKKALALGAFDYLLKPSRRQEILDTVLKLTGEIESEKKQVQSLEHLKEGFNKSLPLLRERTLTQLVLADLPPYDRLLANLKMVDVMFPHLLFGVVVLRIDNFHDLNMRYKSEDIELFKYALKNICEETLVSHPLCTAFEHHDDILLILNSEDWIDIEQLATHVKNIQANVEHYLHFTLSAGIGSFEKGIQHLKKSFSEASGALNSRIFTGTGNIIEYTYEIEESSFSSSYPLSEEQGFLKAVRSGSTAEVEDKLILFFNALYPETVSKDQVLKSGFSLFFALYRLCIENNVNVNKVFGQDLTELTQILARSGLDNLLQSLLDIALKVHAFLTEKKNSSKLFESLINYLHKNYMRDINREIVASELYITPGYVSLLFKQNMKISFIDYLHKIRIENACLQLNKMELRIEDIAQQVGYNDPKYFYQVFKKYKGITPSQYRNSTNRCEF